MTESDYSALVTMAFLLAGVFYGSWQEKNLWTQKSKSITRKECRGKLYWVVEDGDKEKLEHIIECFEETK